MKLFSLFAALTFILVDCQDDDSKLSILPSGTYRFEIFNSGGKRVLNHEDEVERVNHGEGHEEIRLHDSSMKDFAVVIFSRQSQIAEVCKIVVDPAPSNVTISTYLFQRWYSLQEDWGYKCISGALNIREVDGTKLSGDFKIIMQADEPDWTSNPLWGKDILIKGYFTTE